jgi:SHS2 domain-containing protein
MPEIVAPAGDPSPRPPFEVLEHTADAGIVASGATWNELFANAALGMFSLMAELDGVRPAVERRIEVEAADREALMVLWLTELLYYLDAEELLFSRFEVEKADETRLRARVFGERIDPERHRLHMGVKAVTRHMLEVGPEEGGAGYRARILFDI